MVSTQRALLTNEALLKTKKRSDSSTTTTTASSDSSAVEGERLDHGVLSQLNFDNGIVGDKLSQINSHRDNVAARQAVLDRAAAASSTLRTLDRSKKLTSGKLVASNMYQLDEFVRDHQISVAQHNQEEAAKKEERKRTRDEKLHADVAAARAKEEKDLTVKDLKALNTYKKPKKGSPLGKTLPSLLEQWRRRKNNPSPPRPQQQQAMPPLQQPVDVRPATEEELTAGGTEFAETLLGLDEDEADVLDTRPL